MSDSLVFVSPEDTLSNRRPFHSKGGTGDFELRRHPGTKTTGTYLTCKGSLLPSGQNRSETVRKGTPRDRRDLVDENK